MTLNTTATMPVLLLRSHMKDTTQISRPPTLPSFSIFHYYTTTFSIAGHKPAFPQLPFSSSLPAASRMEPFQKPI
ncbi:hypothetical protein I7I50_09568 [Histoplasma capsulatum G186AR]|uniref:Uncharacterized protein n=1 Tax=Ajellomyces capsulatus TaxID=5037 RepID=A0A8H7YQ51_AJECA|nr:hypothetical protein I7I52_07089 [Histoplasma capsulatum]QSS74422.1 hypothetical protein I7I50_09568 [Histoplasma capsulatum G186AR]